jgi:carbonic anhydrase
MSLHTEERTMEEFHQLFHNNRSWAEERKRQDPDFFKRLSKQQTPEFLWIGCADSRVPANEIVGLLPGELFVHRNIANLVIHTDLNCLSVLHFAVDILRIRHIIVCGHYGCSGVLSALHGKTSGLSENWLRHVEDLAVKHDHALCAIDDEAMRANHLCEINVMEQVQNVCRTSIVKNAWARGQSLSVHGVIYSIEDGILHDLGISSSGKTTSDMPTPHLHLLDKCGGRRRA